jgi:hypothetical protein
MYTDSNIAHIGSFGKYFANIGKKMLKIHKLSNIKADFWQKSFAKNQKCYNNMQIQDGNLIAVSLKGCRCLS